MSKGQKEFIHSYKKEKLFIHIIQIFLILFFFGLWQVLSDTHMINSFIFSSPKKVLEEVWKLIIQHQLWNHVFVTLYETIIAFLVSIFISFLLSILLYLFPFFNRVMDPFLTCMNSLPKVALGPMVIIVCGANQKSIIVMAILISVIICTTVITNGFYQTSPIKLLLMTSLKASKIQTLKYLVIPNSRSSIVSALKLGISMSMIGVISGEFLVSKEGLGYLIIYGTQIFNMNLVIGGILLLVIISYGMYFIVKKIR